MAGGRRDTVPTFRLSQGFMATAVLRIRTLRQSPCQSSSESSPRQGMRHRCSMIPCWDAMHQGRGTGVLLLK